LHLAGRLREARAVTDEGLAHELRPNYTWLPILAAELAFEAGDWDDAERMLTEIRRRPVGNALVNRAHPHRGRRGGVPAGPGQLTAVGRTSRWSRRERRTRPAGRTAHDHVRQCHVAPL
jgi:hypothetical protein